MNYVGRKPAGGSRFRELVLCVATLVAVGCGGHVDLGRSAPSGSPEPVTNERELAAQTENLVTVESTEMSSLAIDGDFLYFISWVVDNSPKLWRCQKSNCSATLSVVANPLSEAETELRLNANRLGWQRLNYDGNTPGLDMCDVPDCQSRHSLTGANFVSWDESLAYGFNDDYSSLYRCPLSGCSAGKTLLASSLSGRPADFSLFDGRLYWSIDEGIVRASVDIPSPAERLSLGNVTEWTPATSGQESPSDVSVLDMELDGPYVYAALRVGNQNANETLGCDACKAGIAVARWQHSASGATREWVLANDADLAGLHHLRVFGGEMVWGTNTGDLWSCAADRCSTSKRQIGIEDASSHFGLVRAQMDYVAMDEQSIFWLSVPCWPRDFYCNPNPNARAVWTLKRTPRIPH
ncbi:MAG TPA: hypothetical protein VFK05_33505 [Polyangiaceae bacterium]|nr:hypothetical protein [Polyangiaceae bacterium]